MKKFPNSKCSYAVQDDLFINLTHRTCKGNSPDTTYIENKRRKIRSRSCSPVISESIQRKLEQINNRVSRKMRQLKEDLDILVSCSKLTSDSDIDFILQCGKCDFYNQSRIIYRIVCSLPLKKSLIPVDANLIFTITRESNLWLSVLTGALQETPRNFAQKKGIPFDMKEIVLAIFSSPISKRLLSIREGPSPRDLVFLKNALTLKRNPPSESIMGLLKSDEYHHNIAELQKMAWINYSLLLDEIQDMLSKQQNPKLYSILVSPPPRAGSKKSSLRETLQLHRIDYLDLLKPPAPISRRKMSPLAISFRVGSSWDFGEYSELARSPRRDNNSCEKQCEDQITLTGVKTKDLQECPLKFLDELFFSSSGEEEIQQNSTVDLEDELYKEAER